MSAQRDSDQRIDTLHGAILPFFQKSLPRRDLGRQAAGTFLGLALPNGRMIDLLQQQPATDCDPDVVNRIAGGESRWLIDLNHTVRSFIGITFQGEFRQGPSAQILKKIVDDNMTVDEGKNTVNTAIFGGTKSPPPDGYDQKFSITTWHTNSLSFPMTRALIDVNLMENGGPSAELQKFMDTSSGRLIFDESKLDGAAHTAFQVSDDLTREENNSIGVAGRRYYGYSPNGSQRFIVLDFYADGVAQMLIRNPWL